MKPQFLTIACVGYWLREFVVKSFPRKSGRQRCMQQTQQYNSWGGRANVALNQEYCTSFASVACCVVMYLNQYLCKCLTSHVDAKWRLLQRDGGCDTLISGESGYIFFLRAPPLLLLTFIPPLLSSLLLVLFFLIIRPVCLYICSTGDALSSPGALTF